MIRLGKVLCVLFLCGVPTTRAAGQDLPVPAADTLDPDRYEQLQGAETMEEIEPPGQDAVPPVRPGGARDDPGGWDAWFRSRWSGKLQTAKGYETGAYAGNRWKVYNRIRLRRKGSLLAGIVTEKDPGEAGALDFISFTLSTENRFTPVRITLGDFHASAGQGLVFGPSRRFGKGSSVTSVVPGTPAGISPSLSSDESMFYRGAAVSLSMDAVTLTVMASLRSLSATGVEEGDIPVLDHSGYHRTLRESGRRGNVTERLAGCILRFDCRGAVACGVNLYTSSYSIPVRVSRVTGRTAGDTRRGSVDFTFSRGPVRVVAEWEWWSGFPSGILGAEIRPVRDVTLVIVHRRYDPGADILHGSAFGEATAGGNEAGTYAGIEGEFIRGVKIATYVDLNRSLAPSDGSVFPEMRLDRLFQFTWSPVGTVRLSMRYRVKAGETTGGVAVAPGETAPSATGTYRLDRWRIGSVLVVARSITGNLRLDHVRYTHGDAAVPETGTALSFGVETQPARRCLLWTSVTLFDTDSFMAGIHRLERGLPGTLSGMTLSGEGVRWSTTCSYEISGLLKLSLMYSFIRRDDRRRIGSGTEEMPSNVVEQAGAQVDVRW